MQAEAGGGVGAVHDAASPAGELLHQLLRRAAGVVAAAGDGGGERYVQHIQALLGERAPEVQELAGVYLAGFGNPAGAHETVKLTEALLGHLIGHELAVHGERHLVGENVYFAALLKREVAAGIRSYLIGFFTHCL